MLTIYYRIAYVSWKSLPVILFNTMANSCFSYRLIFTFNEPHACFDNEIYKTLLLSHFSHIWLFETLWTASLICTWGFSRQEYWSGLPHPPPGDLSNPEMEPTSLRSSELAGMFFTNSATWEALIQDIRIH